MRLRAAPSFSIAATVASMHAGERAVPAGMGGADHAALRIGEQHRPAVGGGDAEGERPAWGDHGVGARPRVAGPGRFGDNDVPANGSDSR